jgi:hypothetical protein
MIEFDEKFAAVVTSDVGTEDDAVAIMPMRMMGKDVMVVTVIDNNEKSACVLSKEGLKKFLDEVKEKFYGP